LTADIALSSAAVAAGLLSVMLLQARALPPVPRGLGAWSAGFAVLALSFAVTVLPWGPLAPRLVFAEFGHAANGMLVLTGSLALAGVALSRIPMATLWAAAGAWALCAPALGGWLGTTPGLPISGFAGPPLLAAAWVLARAARQREDGRGQRSIAAVLALFGVLQISIPLLNTMPGFAGWGPVGHLIVIVALLLVMVAALMRRLRLELTALRRRALRGEARLRDAMEGVTEPFALFDASDRLVFCNARCRALFAAIGGPPVPGTAFETLLREVIDQAAVARPDLTADERDREAWIRERLARTGKAHQEPWHLRLRTGDMMRIRETATRDGGRALLAEDVTDRLRWEQDLRDSRQRFRDLAEIASDWFWETGPDQRFTFVSQRVERSLGLTPQHFIGQPMTEVSGGEAPPPCWQRVSDLMDRRERFRDVVVTLAVPNGEVRNLRISGRPMMGDDGQFRGYRGAASDVTDQTRGERSLREARDAAERANRAKATFLANVSHELRTPLNAIIGFSEIMEAGLFGPITNASYKGYVSDILDSARHLLSVINDILDMSRSEAGRLELSESVFAIADLIDDAIRIVGALADNRGLMLENEAGPDLPHLRADERRLRQVMLNLLSNAIKFSETGGRVTVRACLAEWGDLCVQVIDQGIGMTEAEIRQAQETFVQVDERLARRSEGTGLGLPLSSSLVALHGGTLVVDSRKGVGTTVTITLPALRVVAGTAEEKEDRARDSGPS